MLVYLGQGKAEYRNEARTGQINGYLIDLNYSAYIAYYQVNATSSIDSISPVFFIGNNRATIADVASQSLRAGVEIE
ncbi:MAG: hypothetical protein ACJAT7_002561 [Psychromonas sp.]|jgi:hypothetical protein